MGVPVGYPPTASPYTSYTTQPPSYASLQQAQPAQASAAEKAMVGTCAPSRTRVPMHFHTRLVFTWLGLPPYPKSYPKP